MAWVSMSRFGTYPPSLPPKGDPIHTTLFSFPLRYCSVPLNDPYLVDTVPILAVGIQLVNTLLVLVSMLPWEVTSCQVLALPLSGVVLP